MPPVISTTQLSPVAEAMAQRACGYCGAGLVRCPRCDRYDFCPRERRCLSQESPPAGVRVMTILANPPGSPPPPPPGGSPPSGHPAQGQPSWLARVILAPLALLFLILLSILVLLWWALPGILIGGLAALILTNGHGGSELVIGWSIIGGIISAVRGAWEDYGHLLRR